MSPKSAKKKQQPTAGKNQAARRTTIDRANNGGAAPIRLRQKFDDTLKARSELLKQADAALHESQEQAAAKVAELESLLNVTPIPIWIARSSDCRHITGNQAAAELIGAPLETNVSQTPGEHPVEVPMVFRRAGRELAPHELPMQRAAASGQPVSDEFEMMFPDGRVKYLCGRAIPLKDAAGAVTGVVAAFSDITDRKRAESVFQQAHEQLEQQVRERTAQLAELNAKLEQQLVESRVAEAALRESEQRFSTFFDHAQNLAFVKGLDGRYLYVNRRFEEVFRFKSGTVLGRTDRELFACDQADHFQAHDRQVLDSGQAKEFEERAWHGDGLHTSIVVKFPLRDEDGRVRAIGGVATDITDRKRTEETLRAVESRQRLLLTATPVVLYACKATGDYGATFVSENVLQQLGHRPQDLTDQSDFWLTHIHPDDRPRVLAGLSSMFDQDRHTHEYRFCHRDGTYRWLHDELRLIRDETGAPQEIIGFQIDITERRRAVEELRHSESFINSVVEYLPSMIFVKAAQDLRFVRINKACEGVLGYAENDFIGKNDYDLFPKDEADFFTAKDREVLAGGHLLDIPEEPVRTRDGSIRYLHTKKIPIAGPDGVPQYLLGISEDITDRKRTEDRLRDNERALTCSREELRELTGQLLTAQDDERKRIARDLHDDYNQRLAAVAVDLQVLGKSIPASMQDQMTAIQKQVEALSDDIHDLAYHLHPSLLDDVGLEVALRDLVQTFGQREQIGVSVSFNQVPGQLPKAMATCLYRVAQESLRNVAKHGKASEAVVMLSGSRLGLGLSVSDTGKGFTPDQTTVPNHQGLGLKSMQERLRLVNGVFNVQSRPGYGTKVCAWIPFSEGGS